MSTIKSDITLCMSHAYMTSHNRAIREERLQQGHFILLSSGLPTITTNHVSPDFFLISGDPLLIKIIYC